MDTRIRGKLKLGSDKNSRIEQFLANGTKTLLLFLILNDIIWVMWHCNISAPIKFVSKKVWTYYLPGDDQYNIWETRDWHNAPMEQQMFIAASIHPWAYEMVWPALPLLYVQSWNISNPKKFGLQIWENSGLSSNMYLEKKTYYQSKHGHDDPSSGAPASISHW